jgi:putative exosortase-associated protein (TIGR04073 family)
MKHILMTVLIIVLTVSAAYAAETEEKDTAYRIRRGVNNLMLGWLEIPRNIKYEDAKTPYAGFFYGLVKGPVMTVWRTTAGAVDIVGLGQTGPGLYMGQIPDNATDAKWRPDPQAKKATPKLEKKAQKKLKAEKKIRKAEKKTNKKVKAKTAAEKAEAQAKRKAKKAAKEAAK